MLISDVSDPRHHAKAFDASTGWGAYYGTVSILGKLAPASQLNDVLRNERLRFPRGSLHVRISTQPRETFWESMGSRVSTKESERLLAAAGTFLLPGIPLVHSGDETGSLHELRSSEKNTVDWNAKPKFQKLYKRLIEMKKDEEVLRRGGSVYLRNSNEEMVTSFERQHGGDRAIVLLNWGEASTTVAVHPQTPGRVWKEYSDGELFRSNEALEISLKPYSFKVFLSEGQPQ